MKIGLLSLGCPKNLVDGEVMLGLAERAGHTITPDASEADVLVVNTCAFIDSAKQESIDAILEMAGHKRDGRCRRLVVTGCLAERYRDELIAQIPEIDAALGTGEVPEIVGAIEGEGRLKPAPKTGTAAPVTFFKRHPAPAPGTRHQHPEPRTRHRDPARGTRHPSPSYLYSEATPRHLTTPRHYAYVKVAEGCDYTCSFCIIPTLRGRYRSRPADSIVREVRSLAARGVREVNLVSQDTSFYGVDRRQRGELGRLLRALNSIDGLAWIRMLYLYPTTITDDVLDAMVECDRVCRYVDLPLQHGSSAVLKRMRRPGTRRTYERLLRRIRDRVPGVALRTTFIVGFPGETKADFAELESFVRDTAFDHVGVFTYSHEDGTRAHAFEDDVPAGTKRARRRRLMSVQKRLVARRQRARVGERVQVLVDGTSAESPLVLQGRLEGQAPEIDPVVYLTDCDPTAYAPGALIPATVVGARDYDLLVRPLP
jgi:ribosomal protein S12 methylthiotransferase